MSARHRLRRPWHVTLRLLALLVLVPLGAYAQGGGAPRTVSLRDALALARRDPPRVLLALATLKRANAIESYARSAYFPVVTLQATGGIAYDNRLVLPNTPRIDSQYLTAQGTLIIDWAGLNLAREASIDGASAQARAQRAGVQGARREAQAAAAELFVRAQFATQIVEDAKLSLKRRTDQHRGIAGLVRSGLRPPVDAQRAEVEMVSSRYMLEMRQTEERATFSALAVALGRDPADPVRPEPLDPGVFEGAMPADAEARALEHRPEVAQAALTVEARDGDRRAALNARLPTLGVTLTGSVSYLDVLSGVGIDGYTYNGSALAYLRWNGLDPAVWTRAGIARAALAEASATRRAVRLQVRAEVSDALYAARRAQSELERSRAVLTAARAAREAQNGRYSTGNASLLELLDAEGLEQTARLSLIEAERDAAIASLRLLSACGLLDRLPS